MHLKSFASLCLIVAVAACGDQADPCASDNGGCDPLTTCTSEAGVPRCGACPQGYAGDGQGGCIDAASAPIAAVLSQQNVTCAGRTDAQVQIGVTHGVAPITYALDGGVFQPSNTFTALAAGTYTVVAKDAYDRTSSVTFTLTAPPPLTFTSTPTAVTCNSLCNGQVAISASGGTAPYEYSAGATYVTDSLLTGVCGGALSLSVRDANGCVANDVTEVTAPAALTATFNKTDACHDACNGQLVAAGAGGTAPYTYAFNGGTLQASSVLSGLCGPTDIAVTVQDANGCQYTTSQSVTELPAFGVAAQNVVEANCGFNNGSFVAVADGANAPFRYAIDGGALQDSATFDNLYGGAYEVTAVDALGCTARRFVGVSDIEMDGALLSRTDATCFGAADGSAEVTNISGANPIQYQLDNSGTPQSSGFFGSIVAGSHAVSIADGGNCVFVVPFDIAEPEPITFATAVSGAATSIAFTDTEGGTGSYRYSIDGGATFQSGATFSGLAPGTYELVVTDANACVATATVTL